GDEHAKNARPTVRVVAARHVVVPRLKQPLVDGGAAHHEREPELVLARTDPKPRSYPLVRGGGRRALIAVRQRVVVAAADLGAVYGHAVVQDLEREWRLEAFQAPHRARRRLPLRGSELVLAVDRKVMVHDETAARAERQTLDPLVLRKIGRRLVLGRARLDIGVADGDLRD